MRVIMSDNEGQSNNSCADNEGQSNNTGIVTLTLIIHYQRFLQLVPPHSFG